MKKFLSFLFALTMIATLPACGDDDGSSKKKKSSSSSVSEVVNDDKDDDDKSDDDKDKDDDDKDKDDDNKDKDDDDKDKDDDDDDKIKPTVDKDNDGNDDETKPTKSEDKNDDGDDDETKPTKSEDKDDDGDEDKTKPTKAEDKDNDGDSDKTKPTKAKDKDNDGDSDKTKPTKAKDKNNADNKSNSGFVGKWEAESMVMDGMTLDSIFGIPMYALINLEIKDDGTFIMASPMEKMDLEGSGESYDDSTQKGKWKTVDKDTISISIEEDGAEETVNCDLKDGKLIMKENEDEESGETIVLVKVDEFTEVDFDKIMEDLEGAAGSFGDLDE